MHIASEAFNWYLTKENPSGKSAAGKLPSLQPRPAMSLLTLEQDWARKPPFTPQWSAQQAPCTPLKPTTRMRSFAASN
jgi:hypothetical protein